MTSDKLDPEPNNLSAASLGQTSKSPRILFILDFQPKGRRTFERFLLALNRELSRQGFELAFVFSGQPAAWFLEELEPAIRVSWRSANPFSHGAYLHTLCEVLRCRPTLVVLSFLPLFSWKALLLALYSKCIYIDQTSAEVHPRRGLRRLLAQARGAVASRLYRAIVSVSEHNRRRNVERNFIAPSKNRVIHNGISLTDVPRPAGEQRCFFYAGQLERFKGVFTLIDAFDLFLQETADPNMELWIAGLGSDEESLRAHARAKNCHARIRFLGFRDDVPRLMAQATACIVPSEWAEAFGLVVAEAMHSGSAVIASDVGAIPEVLGACGLLFEPGNASMLAHQMKAVSQAGASLDKMRQCARVRVAHHFSMARMVDQYVELFREVAGECGSPHGSTRGVFIHAEEFKEMEPDK